MNDIELPKDNTHKIRVAIKEATRDYRKQLMGIDSLVRQLYAFKNEKEKLSDEKKLQEKIFELQKKMRDVKFQFFEMLKMVL